MAFVSSFYVLFYVKERISGSKHLQYVSGVNVSTLWSVSFLWDFVLYLIICFFLLASLLAFQEDGYDTVSDMSMYLVVNFYQNFIPIFCFSETIDGFVHVRFLCHSNDLLGLISVYHSVQWFYIFISI